MQSNMRGQLLTVLSFAAMLAILLGVLTICRVVPTTLEPPALQRYASLEAMRNALHPTRLRLPTYYPPELEWPPAEIIAGNVPSFRLLLHFRGRQHDEILLAIRQSADSSSEPQPRLVLATTLQSNTLTLKGHACTSAVGLCGARDACNAVECADSEGHVLAIGRLSMDEVIRVATSLLDRPLPL